MSTLHSPPKIRSYLDHRTHVATDLFRQSVMPKTYTDHWPGLSDMFGKPRTKKTVSYVPHFAKPGDLNTM